MTTLEKTMESYVNKLLTNHNLAKEEEQKNLLTKEDYIEILKPVISIVQKNGDLSLEELRELLYKESNVEDVLTNSIYERRMAPGAVISYGTPYYNEIISLGKTSEIRYGYDTYEDTIYDLASVTKLFTSISIQLLSRIGRIDLNKSVTYYLPEFKGLENITIYQLLTFNASVKTDGRIDRAEDKEEALEILKTISFDPENNGKRPYTDMGAMILKYVIEKVSKMDYYTFVSKFILEPAKMNNTYVSIPYDKLKRVADTGYDGFYYKDGKYRINDVVKAGDCYDAKARIMGQRDGNLSGHAGLFSTGKDMSNLSIALLNNEILTSEELVHTADNRTGNKEKGIQYLGKLCYSKNPVLEDSEVYHPLSGRTVASAGWTGTQLTIDPDNKVFYSLLSNRSHNRMTFIDADKKHLVKTSFNGKKMIELPNGLNMIDATRYAWDRDETLVHPVIRLAIQNRFLEEIYKKELENKNESRLVKTRRI